MNRTPVVGLKSFRFDDRRCGFLYVGIAGVVAGPRLGTPATLGVAGVGVGTDFVSLTTLWRAYRRQRYRSWSSADAEGVFCVVCVQLLALCRRWAQQASLLGQVLDCRRRRECTQRCWSASVWQLGAVEEGLCGVVPPKDWQVGWRQRLICRCCARQSGLLGFRFDSGRKILLAVEQQLSVS